MAATSSIWIPRSTIEENGGVLPPSAYAQNAPRSGRSRAASLKGGKSARGRRYSVVENRDVAISKAVAFALKRSVLRSELEDDEDDDPNYIVADDQGWVSAVDLLRHPKVADLRVTLSDLQRVESTSSKPRFTLRRSEGHVLPGEANSYEVRGTQSRDSSAEGAILEGEVLDRYSDDLPDFVVYETTYEAYPQILSSGAIRPAAGATHIPFMPVSISETGKFKWASEADVNIWIDSRNAMEKGVELQRATSGTIFTTGEIPKSVWEKVVARRPDVGVLFEDGQVRGEVPEGLRGRGSKGKAKNGKAFLKSRSEEDSDSASDDYVLA